MSAALMAAAAGALAAGVAPRAVAQDAPSNAVEWKRAIEVHYATKIGALLAPSFRQPPAVSVEVELDLDSVQRTVEKTADRERTVETVVGTPGAVRRRSIAVALPADEIPAGFGPAMWRPLIEKGLALGADDRLEIVSMPFRPPPAPPVAPEPDAWARAAGFLPAAGHVLWAAVALVLGTLFWSAARRFADREPMPAPAVALVPAPAAAPPRPPTPRPAAAPAKPVAAKPAPMADPVTALRRAAERDPARVADALRGWVKT